MKIIREFRIVIYDMNGSEWWTLRDPRQKRGCKIRASSNAKELFLQHLGEFIKTETQNRPEKP